MSGTDDELPRTGKGPDLGGLLRHSAIYSAAPMLRQVISVGMTHFYTKWLGTGGFGFKEVVDLWMIGLQQILGSNVLGAMVRFYYDQKTPAERASTVTSSTFLVTVVAWLVCGTAFFFRADLQPLMLPGVDDGQGTNLVHILGLTLLLIPFQLSTLSGFYYLMTIKRSGLYTTIQTAKLLVEVVLNFVLIGGLGLGVEGFLISMLIGEALTSVFLCGWMIRTLGARFDWNVLRPILAYAIPLVPVGICQLALHNFDRRLLLAESAEMTGVYGLAYKIGFMSTAMFLGPFIQIWHPWIYDMEDAKERALHVAQVGTWAVIAIATISLAVILFGRQATVILDGDGTFLDAYRVIPYIAVGYVFWALYHVSQIPLFIAKRTVRLFGINLAAVGINIGLNLYLIPRHGYVGAGIATALSFAALAAMGMIAGRSIAKVPFEWGRLGATIVLVIAGGAIALWIDDMQTSGGIAVLGAIGAKALSFCAIASVLWLAIVRQSERRELISWVSAKWRRRGS